MKRPLIAALKVSVAASFIVCLDHSFALAEGLLCPNGYAINGQCYDAGGFSGAALASQALSSLSQTSTQESSENLLRKIKERREQEESRDKPVAPVAAPVVAPAPVVAAPAAETRPSSRRRPRVAARPHRAEPARVTRVEEPEERRVIPRRALAKRHERPLRATVVEPLPRRPAPVYAPYPYITKGPLFGPPVPIDPDARYGAWFQGYGDYERRNASGGAYVNAGGPGLPAVIPVQINAVSRTTTFGFQIGADLTTRGIFAPNDGLITGAMVGFARSDMSLKTSAISSSPSLLADGFGHMDASFTGGNVGIYGTYFRGPFSADLIVKTDIFSLSENFTDFIAFAPNFAEGPTYGPLGPLALWSKYDPIPVVDVSLAGDLNYRFAVAPGFWIEPTVGARYTNTMYNGKAQRIGLADGEQVRLEGGARFGSNFLLGATPATLVLTGLAYDDVLVTGGFDKSQAFEGGNLLARSDQGQLRGRGVVALNLEHGYGVSSFVQGEVRGGTGLIGAGGKLGVRYRW